MMVNVLTLREKIRITAIHALFWAGLIIYETGVVAVNSGVHSQLIDYLLHFPLNIGLFYTHAWLLQVNLGKPRRSYLLLAGLLILEFCLFDLVKYGADTILLYLKDGVFDPPEGRRYFIVNTWRALYFAGFATAYWAFRSRIDSERQLMRAEKELMQSRNAFLHAQINPHLLFNSLNFIYSTMEGVSERAARAVLLLSRIMDYSLKPLNPDDLVSLGDECTQIANMIDLNAMRSGGPGMISFHCDIDDEAGILPLVLLTFVENIFKHGEPGTPATVRVQYRNGRLFFKSVNRKRRISVNAARPGLGLANVRARLQHYYGNNFRLAVLEKDDTFTLKLAIKPLKYENPQLLYRG